MALPVIFCPQCDTLILDAEQCPSCQWLRPTSGGEVGEPAWAVALEANLPSKESHAVISDSFVYLPTESGQVVALNILEAGLEEKVKWRHQIDSRYRCHSVAVWKDYVLLGNEFSGGFPTPPGELILLNAKSGDELWRHKVEGASLSVPLVKEGIAYFATNSGWIYAVDLAARQDLWRRQVGPPWSWAPAAPTLTPSGLLLLASRGESFVAFDIEAGEVAWSFEAPGWFPHTPRWVDGMVYVRCWDSHIYALDDSNGQEIWKYKPPRDLSSEPWLTDKYLYIGVKDYRGDAEQGDRSYALCTFDRQTGERVGRFEVAGEGRIYGRPAATDEAVFFATDDRSRIVKSQGTLYALDARGNELLWEPCVVEQRFQTNLLVAGELIIAGTRQGAIYAVPWRSADAITKTPQSYAGQGEWDKAAVAYALQNEYSAAAKIYAEQLGQPLLAGRLYLQAGENRKVVNLLGQSKNEEERAVALNAALSVADTSERAEALCDMGEYLAAANIYAETGKPEQAGDCYLEARAWQEAKDAYAEAEAWEKWENLTREQELWHDLVERFIKVGDFAQAAEVQLGRGLFLEAATYFDQAQMAKEALDAYRHVDANDLTEQIQRRMLELAEETGQLEAAFESYKALGQLDKAAELAETSGHYAIALELYQEIGENLKAAEVLEKLSRFVDAADMYEQAMHYGQAAVNLEQQVKQEIERVGGMRYLRETDQIETWLNRAIKLYEDEADYAGEEERKRIFETADRCRVDLMRVRREPLLRLSIQADRLVYDQGNTVHYVVENAGWGTARDVTLAVTGANLRDNEHYELGFLGRRQKVEGDANIVPTLVGQIQVQIELRGHSKSGELEQSLTENMQVVQVSAEGGAGVSVNAQIGHGAEGLRSLEAPIADRGSLWDVGSSSSASTTGDTGPISLEQLQHQRTSGRSNRPSRLRKKRTVQPISTGAAVISSVVVPIGLEAEEQDLVNTELKWLFSAIDNLLKIQDGEIDRNQAVSVPIPDDAERLEQTNNKLLPTIDEFDMPVLEEQIELAFNRINSHLRNLNILLDEEAKRGTAAKSDVDLQYRIRSGRTEIVEVLQQMAQLMYQAYGVFVASPEELVDQL